MIQGRLQVVTSWTLTSSTPAAAGEHCRHDNGAAYRRHRLLWGPSASTAPDNGASAGGSRVHELAAELAAGEAVQVEVDGVVDVHEEERDGLERHQTFSQLSVDLAHGEDEPARGERRRQDQPRERYHQQHRRDLRLTLTLTLTTAGNHHCPGRSTARHTLDGLCVILTAVSTKT